MNYNFYQNPYQRNSLGSNFKAFFQSGSTLSILIIINVAIWLMITIITLVSWLFNVQQEYVHLAAINILGVSAYFPTLIARPWTLITYMFSHLDLLHILFNMLWLFWFGKIFLEFLSQKKLLSIYLWGGIFGAFLYVLSYNIFPVFLLSLEGSRTLGASAAVMAIVAAISFYAPNYRMFFGRVRLIYFALIYLFIDLISIPHGNPGGHISHLGGALFGILYAWNLRKGFFTFSAISRFFKNIFQKKRNNAQRQRPLNDEMYNLKKKEEQDEINRILDKISKHGYDALSKREKETLFKRQN
ncbi:MAG: rhomboid family intramembrane serine protease [Bacteroidales bacterium]|jgi:membrane associated rhomboid family serine protease|nr:rhomboid family intramembrane serine protease [Bacteroidales bacterium]